MSNAITSDDELIQQANAAPEGDFRAFERIVQRYQQKVAANCRYITGDPANADDLAQEVFLKVFFALKGFERRSSFRTWLQRIKVNHCLNHLRKTRGKIFVDAEDEVVQHSEQLQVGPTAERNIIAASEAERIRSALETMADTLRIPLILRDMDGLSYEEVAETLGIGLSAVKMRIKRARAQFRERFEEEPDSEMTPRTGDAGR